MRYRQIKKQAEKVHYDLWNVLTRTDEGRELFKELRNQVKQSSDHQKVDCLLRRINDYVLSENGYDLGLSQNEEVDKALIERIVNR